MQQTFGKYCLVDRLAFGGMAEVFIATLQGEAGFSKPVVIKRLHPRFNQDSEFTRMLIDEARITAQLTHTNICQVLDLGSVNGSYFIAMEHVAGEDLRALLEVHRQKKSFIPVEAAVYVVAEMLAGLDYAHRKEDAEGHPLGVIHRDVSPQNVLISYEGEVKVIDFGIAKARQRLVQTQAGVIKGKFRYMSPEQAGGHSVDARTDIFAAGVVLYELLRGEPHSLDVGDTEVLRRMQEARFEPIHRSHKEVPDELLNIVSCALQRKPRKRFQTAGEFRRALLGFLAAVGDGRRKRGGSIFGRSELAEVMKAAFPVQRQRQRSLAGRSTPSPLVDLQDPVQMPAPPMPAASQQRSGAEPPAVGAVPPSSNRRDAVTSAAGGKGSPRRPDQSTGHLGALRSRDPHVESGAVESSPEPDVPFLPSSISLVEEPAMPPRMATAPIVDLEHQVVRRVQTHEMTIGDPGQARAAATASRVISADERVEPAEAVQPATAGMRRQAAETAISRVRDEAFDDEAFDDEAFDERSRASSVSHYRSPSGVATGRASPRRDRSPRRRERPVVGAFTLDSRIERPAVRPKTPAAGIAARSDAARSFRSSEDDRKSSRGSETVVTHQRSNRVVDAIAIAFLVAVFVAVGYYLGQRMVGGSSGAGQVGGGALAVDSGAGRITGGARAAGPRRGTWGRVRVRSRPSGAAIVLCGRQRDERTPATLRIRAGSSCTLRLELDGYQPFEMPVEAMAGKTMTVQATMRPGAAAPRAVLQPTGMVIVTSVQVGTVYIDDVAVGETPRVQVSVAPGRHTVQVHFPALGVRTPRRHVTVRSGAKARLHFDPSP